MKKTKNLLTMLLVFSLLFCATGISTTGTSSWAKGKPTKSDPVKVPSKIKLRVGDRFEIFLKTYNNSSSTNYEGFAIKSMSFQYKNKKIAKLKKLSSVSFTARGLKKGKTTVKMTIRGAFYHFDSEDREIMDPDKTITKTIKVIVK